MKRFLDSVGVPGFRQPVRTLRALDVLVMPRLDAIYFRFGYGIVVKYKLSTFFQRLEGEPLSFPFAANHGNAPERILSPIEAFNVDAGAVKKSSLIDAEEIMTGFDVDDRGVIYAACTIYGWVLSSGGRVVYQNVQETAAKIIALKVGSEYYALQSSGAKSSLWRVTEPSNPSKLPAPVPKVLSFAKNATASRVAIIEYSSRHLAIYSAEGLVSGFPPLFRGDSYASVTSDGENFYALVGNTITVLSPSGGTYSRRPPVTIADMAQPQRIHAGGGYIVVSGSDAAWTWRLYKIGANLSLTPVATDLSPATFAEGMNAADGVVVDGRLILCGKTVGDVYPVPGATPEPAQPSDPLPQAPDFDDQQSETVTQKFVIRASELAAKTAVGWLRSHGVTFAMYGQLVDGTWKVEWR